MPACPACGRYLTPTSVKPDGTCPLCSQVVDYRRNQQYLSGEVPEADETLPPVPWHLKLLFVAAGLYLGWRLVQGVVWVIQHV